MRVLVKAIAPLLGEATASSRRLYQLFPDGPAKQACKIAGLPKPLSCREAGSADGGALGRASNCRYRQDAVCISGRKGR